ncbi:MAG: hypothetical protein GXO25_07950, partial [Euryarchaeota archaeon]|nr:hypothetical protein [Euryarchaeota archaeon]
FWSTILAHAFSGQHTIMTHFDHWLYPLSWGLIILYLIELFTLRSSDANTLFLAGLAAAAVCCFFISLGPLITVGPDNVRIDLAKGPFADIARWVPIFGAVRGLTRFGIVVLVYLIVAACLSVDQLGRKERRFLIALPGLIGLMFYEATKMHYHYADYTYVMKSKVIEKIHHLPKESVVVQLPAAVRTVDATIAMATIGTFPLLINGYSGFTPHSFQQFYKWEKSGWQLDKITAWLTQVWPDVYLVLDKHAAHWLATGWHQPFPLHRLEQDWQLIIEDSFYALYKRKKHTDTRFPVIRRVRTDLLKSHPILFFSARLSTKMHSSGVPIGIFLNGTEIDEEKITPQWHDYQISLPSRFMGYLSGEEIELKLLPESNAPARRAKNICEVKGMHFVTLQ